MQRTPVCFHCNEPVEYDPIYEGPCGHDECPSAVWHGICLMSWREHREHFVERLRKRFEQIAEAHLFRTDQEGPDA